MTAFADLDRGDIVWASDPLSEKGRPLLILGSPEFPNHGVQLITVLLSTTSYHDKSLILRKDDDEGDPLGEQSHVLPWSLATLNSAADIEFHMTSLGDERTNDVATEVIGYIS